MCTDVCTYVPAGIPNETELLNPVGAIPHSGDSGRNGGCMYGAGYLVYMHTCMHAEHAVNIHSTQPCAVYALVLPQFIISL